jgi:SAM-dependent methyltransferase
MLHALRSLGWHVTGLERSEEAAALGRRHFGLEIIAADVQSLPPERCFDFIILFQVLEHLSDPVRVITECYQRLNPGGRIAIAAPNFASWQARFGREVWVHLDVPRHLFHFSPPSLRRILTDAGFQEIEFQYASFEHDPYGWAQTAINRMISPSNTLLRFLMRLPASQGKAAVSFALGALLTVPSVALAMLSWAFRRGAIISATATRR